MKVISDKDVAPLSSTDLALLRSIRIQRGWSYREMSGLMGLSEPTLFKILEGTVEDPRETTVYRIRQWLATYQAQESRA